MGYLPQEYYDSKNYLAHYGIHGQKWGVRRYQNEDGTLTELGKQRYKDRKELVDNVKKVSNEEYKQLRQTAALNAYRAEIARNGTDQEFADTFSYSDVKKYSKKRITDLRKRWEQESDLTSRYLEQDAESHKKFLNDLAKVDLSKADDDEFVGILDWAINSTHRMDEQPIDDSDGVLAKKLDAYKRKYAISQKLGGTGDA